jgi:hypothetical protein
MPVPGATTTAATDDDLITNTPMHVYPCSSQLAVLSLY